MPRLPKSLALPTSSRASSRQLTPEADDNGDLDFSLSNLDEQLMLTLYSADDDEGNKDKQRIASERNDLLISSGSLTSDEIIRALSRPRTEVSSRARELLLLQLHRTIVSKPHVSLDEESPEYQSEEGVQLLVNLFISGNYRSDAEFALLFRAIVALLSSDMDEFGGMVDDILLQHIKKLIQGPNSAVITNENKAHLTTGLSVLLLVMYSDSYALGLEDYISWLLEIAEGYCASSELLRSQIALGDRDYSTMITHEGEDKQLLAESYAKADSEALVAVSAINATGVLLTLMKRGNFLNELIQDKAIFFVEALSYSPEICKAAGKVLALSYELFDYSGDELEYNEEVDDSEYNANSPYYEQLVLFSELERLASVSDKKLAKRERKSIHSVFDNIKLTVEVFTNPHKREEIYKKSPDSMDLRKAMIEMSVLRLSRSSHIAINNWYLYLRLQYLKWCFSFGLHAQLLANESLRDVLREPATSYQIKYGVSEPDVLESFNETKKELDEKQRSNTIRKARINKLDERLDDLQIKE